VWTVIVVWRSTRSGIVCGCNGKNDRFQRSGARLFSVGPRLTSVCGSWQHAPQTKTHKGGTSSPAISSFKLDSTRGRSGGPRSWERARLLCALVKRTFAGQSMSFTPSRFGFSDFVVCVPVFQSPLRDGTRDMWIGMQ